MKLKEFMEETGICQARLALRCGLSSHQVYHVLLGKVPTLKTAMTIENYTKGKVNPRDMLSDEMFEAVYNKKRNPTEK